MGETAGYGTTFSYCATQGGSYTALAEVVDLTPPEHEAEDVKTTHMTTAGKVHTYQAGLIEPGETEVVIHFDKTIEATLRGTLFGADYYFKITFADGSVLAFAGYLKKIGEETPLDDIVVVNLTFKVSGAPTFTPAT